MQIMDLFADLAEEEGTIAQSNGIPLKRESPEQRAERRIFDIMAKGHICVLAFSSGKDSSTLSNLVLNCARQLKERGVVPPPIFVTHSDTGVEMPEIVTLARGELAKMRLFAERHGLMLRTFVGRPELGASFPVRVIGGRALPSFPTTRADCSTDWKLLVNSRLIANAKKTAAEMAEWAEPVVMTGVRQGESTARDGRIQARNETAEGIWENDQGDLRASPILDWDTDSVWEYLGYCAAGVYESYSDFADTMRIYRDAGASSCVIVADMKSAQHSKPCGTRTGCFLCTRVAEDRSMQNMIASDPERYGYLKPLSRLREFISNTQYDWSLRQYVGRTISADGFIEIGADTYSPAMLRDLLIYTLTAQQKSGVGIISVEQLIAIDARWSMYGLWPPFFAIKTYFDVLDGRWEEAPVVERVAKTDVPKIGRIHVGRGWYEATGINAVAGLRDIGMEIFHESCGMEIKALNNGALVCDYEQGDQFAVDIDGASDFLGVLADDLIEEHCTQEAPDWTLGFKTYLNLGIINIAKGQSRSTDEILRRTQWRQQHGLHGQQDLRLLAERCDVRYPQQGLLL